MIKPSDDLAKRLEEEVGAWILPLNTRGHDLILEAAGELHALKKIVDDPGLLRLHAVAIRQKRIEQLEGELAEVKAAFRTIEQALLPDPHDERDVSVDWLRKEIHAAIDAARKP